MAFAKTLILPKALLWALLVLLVLLVLVMLSVPARNQRYIAVVIILVNHNFTIET